jgi:predicted PurR-regulated permease PerM
MAQELTSDKTLLPAAKIPAAPPGAALPEASPSGWRQVRLRARNTTPRELVRLGFVLGSLALIVWLVSQSMAGLLPFVVGGFIAYAVLPAVNRFDRVMPRWLASLAMVFAVLAFVVLFIAALVPLLVNQFLTLFSHLPSLDQIQQGGAQFQQSLTGLPEPLRVTLREIIDEAGTSYRAALDGFIQNLPQVTVQAFLGLISTIGAVLGLLVLPTWLLTVLKDNRQGVRAINNLLPQRMLMDFWSVVRIVDRSLRSFLQQQVALGLLVGAGMAVVALLLDRTGVVDIKYPIAAALIIGALELIPEIGPILIYLVLLLAGAGQGWPAVLIYFVSYFFVHRLASGFVDARVSAHVKQPHAAIMAVVAVLLSQLGLVYALLSVPFIVMSRDLFRYVNGRLSEPPRPAGLLPDEKKLIAPPEQQVLIKTRPPLVYRRAARRRTS